MSGRRMVENTFTTAFSASCEIAEVGSAVSAAPAAPLASARAARQTGSVVRRRLVIAELV